MPTFEITAPDGKVYEVTGDNADGAYEALIAELGSSAPAPTDEVDTFGEYASDIGGAALSGIGRGVVGMLDLPEFAIEGVRRLGQEGLEAAGFDVGEKVDPFGPTLMGGLAEAGLGKVGLEGALDYRGQTMPAQFLGTAAEFAGGGGFTGLVGKGIKKAATSDALVDAVQKLGGSGNFAKAEKAGSALERVGLGEGALRGAAIAGVGSEAAGQATEGTFLEPAARVIGALAAPSVANKTVNLFSQKAAARPTVENLKSYKSAAYNAADAAGVKFSPAEVDGFIKRASSQLDDVNFDPDVDLQTKASLAAITNKAGSELTLGQLDKMRQGLSRRYSRANNEVGILGMIDEIDNLIDSSQMGGELMKSARLANRKFKKAELLESALTKAEDQVASTGSGGNVVNKYKQAISNIINSKSARSFDADEIEVMRRFVRGDLPENALRLIGKLSPSGNGLMMALNIGAVAANPAMIGVTVAGAAAKAGSERLAKGSVEAIKDMIAGGSTPEARKLITDQQIRSLIGLQAE